MNQELTASHVASALQAIAEALEQAALALPPDRREAIEAKVRTLRGARAGILAELMD